MATTNNIHRVLDEAFADVPRTPDTADLKEEMRGNLQAPVREVVHWRHADRPRESFGKPGTRIKVQGLRRKLKGPCMCRVAKQSTLMVLSADDFEAELKVNQPLAEKLGARGE